MNKQLKIEVTGDAKAAEHFMYWLCEQGEQNYWIWMECREMEEPGDITVASFNYDYKGGVATGKLERLSGQPSPELQQMWDEENVNS